MKLVEEKILEFQTLWASGAFECDTCEKTSLANAKAIGSVEALHGFLTFDYEQYLGEKE